LYNVYLYYVGISFIFYVLYVIKLSLLLNLSEETHAQSQYILMYYFKKYRVSSSIFFIYRKQKLWSRRSCYYGWHTCVPPKTTAAMFAQRETQRSDPLFEVKVLKPHVCAI